MSVPIYSAPMDTVANDTTAIYMAMMGAIGVIHRNCSIDEQEAMIRRIKSIDPKKIVPIVDPDDLLKPYHRNQQKTEKGHPIITNYNKVLGYQKLLMEEEELVTHKRVDNREISPFR